MKRLVYLVSTISFLTGCSTGPKWYYQGQPATSEQVSQIEKACGGDAKLEEYIKTHQKESSPSKKQMKEIFQLIKEAKTCMFVRGLSTDKDAQFDINTYLAQIAERYNKHLPSIVDTNSIANEVRSSDRKLTYTYTLFDEETKQLNQKKIKKIKPTITKALCSSPNIELFKFHQVQFEYIYKNKEGDKIASLLIPTSECQ
ncbi:hypothetical protein [Vibrio spartinae]|uniref:Lipoprotein n=1 Tax=Vibrio spartinae TaxID=1918945 RepID=A0ABX6QWP7_9VIBR|nr:hypothetical protein [Vibrio spartinae]QMV13599.1 hypothetical protein Vspart_00837 [Vibrio spartinae]